MHDDHISLAQQLVTDYAPRVGRQYVLWELSRAIMHAVRTGSISLRDVEVEARRGLHSVSSNAMSVPEITSGAAHHGAATQPPPASLHEAGRMLYGEFDGRASLATVVSALQAASLQLPHASATAMPVAAMAMARRTLRSETDPPAEVERG